MENNIREKVIECMRNIGIYMDEEDDFELQDYIDDSVSFITFIVELEQQFAIEIPDSYLTMDSMSTLSDICNFIKAVLDEKVSIQEQGS